MPFPVIHSTLDPQAIGAEARKRFGFEAPVRCRLIARGSNDIYEVQHRSGRVVVRVARAAFRTRSETLSELRFMRHLSSHGLALPVPISTCAGEDLLELEAPEGRRQVVVFSWLDGQARHPLAPDQARQAGQLLAELHRIGRGFDSSGARHLSVAQKIGAKRSALERLLEHHPTDARRVEAAARQVNHFLASEEAAHLARGMTHGDYQPANILLRDNGPLAVIDFDDCGVDVLLMDAACFIWRNRFDKVDDAVDESFLEGYFGARACGAPERDALEHLVRARNLYLLAAYAAYVDRVGPIPGFTSYARFIELLDEVPGGRLER